MVNLRPSFIFLFILFIVGFISAQQGMVFEIVAKLEGDSSTPTIILQTQDSATSDFDRLDLLVNARDQPNYQFYSKISSRSEGLVLDSWNAIEDLNRTFELRYVVLGGANFEGLLNLSWNPANLEDNDGRYYFSLEDYGSDSSLNFRVGQPLNMNFISSYSFLNDVSTRYFKIKTNYKYCGDRNLDSWEECDSDQFGGATCSSLLNRLDNGFLGCSSTCKIEFGGCVTNLQFCGDGVVNLDEQCDGANLSGQTCASLGYIGGSLSCSDCFFNTGQCISSGSSPSSSGPSSGVGTVPSCTNECLSGDRRCVNDSGYQICGKFGTNLCTSWGEWNNCLGINPFCNNGFCFGCLSDSDCIGGFCVNGKCESDCGKTCLELGISCGKKLVCGSLLDCGSCADGFCNAGVCSLMPEFSSKLSENECNPNYLCSPWSECEVSFDSENLLLGDGWFAGKRNRICFDSNNCYSTIRDSEDCLIELNVSSKEVNICGINYIEIYDTTNDKLLARTRDLRYSNFQAIEIFLLPSILSCDSESEQYTLSSFDRFLFSSNIKNLWRLFK